MSSTQDVEGRHTANITAAVDIQGCTIQKSTWVRRQLGVHGSFLLYEQITIASCNCKQCKVGI